MARSWILVAESSRARLYSAPKAKAPLTFVSEFEHPEARAHEQDLITDAPGRRFATGGPKRHGMGQAVSTKDEHALRFARELASRLETARVADRFDHLFLAAAPKFLGLLREQLTGDTKAMVQREYAKNWVHDDPKVIRSHLPEYL